MVIGQRVTLPHTAPMHTTYHVCTSWWRARVEREEGVITRLAWCFLSLVAVKGRKWGEGHHYIVDAR